jgi:hypothetical protein
LIMDMCCYFLTLTHHSENIALLNLSDFAIQNGLQKKLWGLVLFRPYHTAEVELYFPGEG